MGTYEVYNKLTARLTPSDNGSHGSCSVLCGSASCRDCGFRTGHEGQISYVPGRLQRYARLAGPEMAGTRYRPAASARGNAGHYRGESAVGRDCAVRREGSFQMG